MIRKQLDFRKFQKSGHTAKVSKTPLLPVTYYKIKFICKTNFKL